MAAPMEKGELKTETLTNMSNGSDEKQADLSANRRNALMFSAAGLSVLFGFGLSLYNARRREPNLFKKVNADGISPEEGTVLATKALAVATVLSVSSFGLMIVGVFKLMGVNNFHEFHAKLREYFPKKESRGRVDFKNLRDLADYLISEDRKAELAKKKEAKDQS
ncbi:transmembrane protein 242-like [Ruditapes philippinarum]|uniref:transmembrane protein 242-like n=1 Tax=Ruditapes philippinarum TaxID=129788 RepID=UPI00295B6E3D|nr:transmembrane protein 242-like [Ruditapes philippinarum]